MRSCKYSSFMSLNITPPGQRRCLLTDLMYGAPALLWLLSLLTAMVMFAQQYIKHWKPHGFAGKFHHVPAVSDRENTFSTQFYKKIRLNTFLDCVASVQEMFLFQLQFECLTFSKLADKISWQNRSPCVTSPILDYCCRARVSAHASSFFF